ncbi:MAG: heme o synthase, partial [Rhodanobacteraceae bacterium]
MSTLAGHQPAAADRLFTLAGQYLAATKPRIVALLVFTALIGMLLAAPGVPPWRPLVFGLLGIWMASSSAAALNQLIDQRIDRVMARTAHRPLVTGTLTARQVLVFAVVLGVASMLILGFLVNGLTALLTFIGLIGYAVVYTAFLKRATPQNIVIGGLAGAIPPLLGWAAVTGMRAPSDWAYGLLLVLIVFAWTPPHFWSLAIFRCEDYRRACIPMLPVVYGVEYTRWHVLFYTILLVLVSLLPYL